MSDSARNNLANEIDDGLRSLENSEHRRKVGLLRAIDSRRIIVRDNIRSTFLASPTNYFGAYRVYEGVIFKARDGQADSTLADPNRTTIAVPIHAIAPFFKFGPSHDGPPYYVDNPMNQIPENDTLDELLFEVFSRAVMCYTLDEDSYSHEEVEASAIENNYPYGITYLIRTARGRLLVIPQEATLAQIFAGARWPRDGPMPFKDLCDTPQVRDFEDDGVELGEDFHMEIRIIPDYELNAYLGTVDSPGSIDGSKVAA